MEETTSNAEITPEVLMVMSAAIAAYLGKNIRIRKACFICDQGQSSWSQQGRVSIQTSHTFSTTK